MFGVIIEKGPQNWQVVQQKNGYADINLSGSVFLDDETKSHFDGAVFVRVLDQNTNSRIIAPVKVKPINEKWNCTVKIPAGGPYRIDTYYRFNKICEKRGDQILNLGVGDVYVITGQSNAVGVGKDSVLDVSDGNVRMFRLDGRWDVATHPLHDSTDTLFPLSQEPTRTGHSPWINFGKILSKNLGYPIGLIPATKGGIPLSYWDRGVDGAFFDNMMNIVDKSGSEIKGVIWYQGCNDAYSEESRAAYFDRFKKVCADFENSFFENIPILTVQLNKSVCIKNSDIIREGRSFAELREAQRRAMLEIENVYMVPAIDLMVCDGIHNSCSSNMVIGERVANTALRHIYGKEILADAPNIEKALVEDGNRVRLYFENVYDIIFSDFNRTEALMFSVTDELGRIEPVDYDCPGDNTIVLVFERNIEGSAKVSCDKYNETCLMPYDIYTHLPIIPFDNFTIE